MLTASSMFQRGSCLLRKSQISPPAALSPIHSRPSCTMPPPKPVPNVAPNRLRKRFGLPASARRPFTHGRRPAIASPNANRSPSLLMKTGIPKRSSSIGPSATPPRKPGQVAELADDPARVVGRAGEREADRDRRRRGRLPHAREALDDRLEAAREVVAVRGQHDRLADLAPALRGREAELGAAGVEREDDARVLLVAHLRPPSPPRARRRGATARAGRGTRRAERGTPRRGRPCR